MRDFPDTGFPNDPDLGRKNVQYEVLCAEPYGNLRRGKPTNTVTAHTASPFRVWLIRAFLNFFPFPVLLPQKRLKA